MHLPVEVAEKLAHAYASAEPEMVLMSIEDFESEYKAKGYEPGKRYYHDILREKTPGFALARYWAGHEEEVAQLHHEIESACASLWSRLPLCSRRRTGAGGVAAEACLGRPVRQGPQQRFRQTAAS